MVGVLVTDATQTTKLVPTGNGPGVAGLHVASSPGDMLVAMGCLLTLGEELWRSARTSRRLRTDGRLELEGPQGASVKGG